MPQIAQQALEVLANPTTTATVAQSVLEVLSDEAEPTQSVWDSPTFSGIGTYGDECNTGSLDAAWTLRNIASGSGDGAAYSLTFDASGDAITRALPSDPGNTALDIYVHLQGLTSFQPMLGICALDASGNGRAYSIYNDNNAYQWNITSYAYASTGPGIVGANPYMADHWLHLRRESGGTWRGRHSSNGTSWSAFTNTVTDTRVITQIGVLRAYTGTSQAAKIERFVADYDLVTDTLTGGAASQYVLEVLQAPGGPASVGQYVVEALVSVEENPGGGEGGVRTFGWAG